MLMMMLAPTAVAAAALPAHLHDFAVTVTLALDQIHVLDNSELT